MQVGGRGRKKVVDLSLIFESVERRITIGGIEVPDYDFGSMYPNIHVHNDIRPRDQMIAYASMRKNLGLEDGLVLSEGISAREMMMSMSSIGCKPDPIIIDTLPRIITGYEDEIPQSLLSSPHMLDTGRKKIVGRYGNKGIIGSIIGDKKSINAQYGALGCMDAGQYDGDSIKIEAVPSTMDILSKVDPSELISMTAQKIVRDASDKFERIINGSYGKAVPTTVGGGAIRMGEQESFVEMKNDFLFGTMLSPNGKKEYHTSILRPNVVIPGRGRRVPMPSIHARRTQQILKKKNRLKEETVTIKFESLSS